MEEVIQKPKKWNDVAGVQVACIGEIRQFKGNISFDKGASFVPFEATVIDGMLSSIGDSRDYPGLYFGQDAMTENVHWRAWQLIRNQLEQRGVIGASRSVAEEKAVAAGVKVGLETALNKVKSMKECRLRALRGCEAGEKREELVFRISECDKIITRLQDVLDELRQDNEQSDEGD